MNAKFHPYHYTPIVDVDPEGNFAEVILYQCNFEPNTDLTIDGVPVYFTSVIKAAKFLETKKENSLSFHNKLVFLDEIQDKFIIDPCNSCGYYEIQNKNGMSQVEAARGLALHTAVIRRRISILKETALRLLKEQNYDDAFLILKQIILHLDPGEAESHYTIGIIGLATDDNVLITQAEQSLKNIDSQWFEKFINCK